MHPSCCCLLLTVVDQSCAQHSHSLQILLLPLPSVSDDVSDQDLDSSSSSWLSWLVLDCHEPCPPVSDQYLQKYSCVLLKKIFHYLTWWWPGDEVDICEYILRLNELIIFFNSHNRSVNCVVVESGTSTETKHFPQERHQLCLPESLVTEFSRKQIFILRQKSVQSCWYFVIHLSPSQCGSIIKSPREIIFYSPETSFCQHQAEI